MPQTTRLIILAEYAGTYRAYLEAGAGEFCLSVVWVGS